MDTAGGDWAAARAGEEGVVEAGVRLLQKRKYQRALLERGARFNLLVCGRRWGKMKVGMVVAQERREAYDFPVVDFELKGSTKLARSEVVTPLAEGGNVWIPSVARASWVRGWLGEIVGFPQLGTRTGVTRRAWRSNSCGGMWSRVVPWWCQGGSTWIGCRSDGESGA